MLMQKIIIMLNGFIFCLVACLLSAQAQETYPSAGHDTASQVYRQNISAEPLLPFFSSAVLIYENQFHARQGLLFGFWYGKTTETWPKRISYPGHSHNYSAIIAYRRYIWRHLHLEYQIYPGYTSFFAAAEAKRYGSFSLFNELRVGYKFEFAVQRVPLLLNFQLPIGFTLFESNEPESFRAVRKQDPIFYIFIPNIYLGYRF